jgi:uncharacterized protein (TIGR02145 family)
MESNQDVFISHSSADSKLAYAMCHYLEEKGIRCWVAPRDIQGGTEYAEAIIMGIRNCKIMVVLFNKNANDSIYVKNEVERAFNYKSMLIPFKLDQTIPSAALELFLGSVHSLDATNGNPEDCFDLLYQNCVRVLGKKERPIKEKPVHPQTTGKKKSSIKVKPILPLTHEKKENSIKVKPILPKTTEKKENPANKKNEIKIFGEGNYSNDEIQIWTSINLDVETYRNGTKIPQVQDKNAWSKLTTGAWCYYENKTANGKKYGKLYNWYAVNDPRGLAPKGYHIPKFWEEWSFLNEFDGEKDSGSKIKSTTGWDNNGNGTNTNGFNGLPGGYRTADGNFLSIGECGMWWSSTVDGTEGFLRRGTSWAVDLHASSKWSGSPIYLRTGCSVRCVKDLDEQ